MRPHFPLERSPGTEALRLAAASLGLGLGRCNPGDGARWRVGPDAAPPRGCVDFNAAGGPTFRSRAEVSAYLNGYAAAVLASALASGERGATL